MVAHPAQPGHLTYADRYADFRLETVAGNQPGVLVNITPGTLDQHVWVYADRTNTVNGIARSVNGNNVPTYAFPKTFLNSNFNVVYNNGTSEVFDR